MQRGNHTINSNLLLLLLDLTMFASSPFKIIGQPKLVYDGKWVKMREVRFQKSDTSPVQVWESAHRRLVPRTTPDGVDVIAVLRKAGKKYLILVKQYRIPMAGYCLEFPAGLIDDGESVEAAGLRELKEETGYTASRVVSCSKEKQFLCPGLTDESVSFLTVEVDGDAPENRNPIQRLDAGEIIEVVLVEYDKLPSYVKEVDKQVHVEAMVYTFALGMQYSQMFS